MWRQAGGEGQRSCARLLSGYENTEGQFHKEPRGKLDLTDWPKSAFRLFYIRGEKLYSEASIFFILLLNKTCSETQLQNHHFITAFMFYSEEEYKTLAKQNKVDWQEK